MSLSPNVTEQLKRFLKFGSRISLQVSSDCSFTSLEMFYSMALCLDLDRQMRKVQIDVFRVCLRVKKIFPRL